MTLETPTRPATPARPPGAHDRATPVARPRPPLSGLRPPRGPRAELRLSGLLRSARGRLRPRRRARAALTRESIAARAPGIWRYLELLPVERRRRSAGLAVGSTALVRADRLARELGLGTGTIAPSQGRHPQPDAELQGSGRRGRDRAGRRVRLRHPRLRLDRQPRRRDRGRRGRGRAARLRLRPGRPRAGQGRARPELRRDRRPRRRHVRRHQPAQPRDRRRGGLGLRQRQPPAVLRRGQQDDRVRGRRAARLAAAGRPRRPDRLGLDVHEDRQGLRRARRRSASSSARTSGSSAASRRAAPRWRPRSPRASTRSGRSGRPTRSSARSRSARRPTAATRWSWPAGPAARSSRSRTRATAAAIRRTAADEGIFVETAGGVTVAAVEAARARGVIRDGDEVVAILSGNGVKTPDARRFGAR